MKAIITLLLFINLLGLSGISQTFTLTDSIVSEGDILTKDIYFDFNASRILPESFPFLDSLAQFVHNHSKVRIEIGHHTDHRGSASYNLKLSEYRCKMVNTYLVNKQAKQIQLMIRGYGESKPLISISAIEKMNASEEKERAFSINRRTVFTINKLEK